MCHGKSNQSLMTIVKSIFSISYKLYNQSDGKIIINDLSSLIKEKMRLGYPRR